MCSCSRRKSFRAFGQHQDVEGGRDHHENAALEPVARALQSGQGVIQVGDETAGAPLKLFTGFGQNDLAGRALEELGADGVFKLAHPLGGHRGHHIQLPGGLREAAIARHRQKGPHIGHCIHDLSQIAKTEVVIWS